MVFNTLPVTPEEFGYNEQTIEETSIFDFFY